MRAVNLLPRDTAKQRRITAQNLPVVVGAGLGVVVTGALALSFLGAAGKVSSAQQQLNDVTQQLAATPKPAAPAPLPNSQLAGEQSARVTAVSNAIGARVAWDRILREFSLVLPDDVWISSLSLSGGGLTLSGTTYSHESVARMLSRLALIPELSNIVLSGSTASGGDTGAGTPGTSGPVTVTFGITATVALPAGAAAAAPPPVVAPPPATTDTTTTTG
jgi:Tfp pilus assembly protein PilN